MAGMPWIAYADALLVNETPPPSLQKRNSVLWIKGQPRCWDGHWTQQEVSKRTKREIDIS